MFSERSNFSKEQQALILGLTPMNDEAVKNAVYLAQNVPNSYIKFLKNFGAGKIKPPNEPDRFPAHFEILERLYSAEKEYFQDTRIYEQGAKGDVLIFGTESTGICFGFDSGNKNSVVRIDNYRIVENVALNFEQLIFGILACYPDFPETYENGIWSNDLGDKFSMSGLI